MFAAGVRELDFGFEIVLARTEEGGCPLERHRRLDELETGCVERMEPLRPDVRAQTRPLGLVGALGEPDEDEDIEVVRLPAAEVLARLEDGISIAAFGLWMRHYG